MDDIVVVMARKDFLDEMIDERIKANPKFGSLLDAAVRRRELLEELAAEREALGLSQTVVAARMHTSQSAVARLESAEVDAKLSTVERYAAALGKKINWELADA
jgi:ribosome-binding protein aMBF1 (putative translation factor)